MEKSFKLVKFFSFIVLFVISSKVIFGQELIPFQQTSGNVTITERADFSRYENGKYVGLTYRESILTLYSTKENNQLFYNGDVLILEETFKDSRFSAKRLDDTKPVSFFASPRGDYNFSNDPGYPIIRSMPSLPLEAVKQNDKWIGDAVVVVRPNTNAPATRVPILVEYAYKGKSKWANDDAFLIKAQYAIRYKGSDFNGDPLLLKSEGGRNADIYLSCIDGSVLFIRETLDETYFYEGKNTVRLKGFILHFYRGSLPQDRHATIQSLQGFPLSKSDESSFEESESNYENLSLENNVLQGPVVSNTGKPAFEIEESERGIVLRLYDLKFVADSANLLSGEKDRVNTVADALKKLEGRTFLVEGHAADVGKAAGQYKLSEERAKKIVDELSSRGIPASQFVYRGLGGDVPIADNKSEDGRAKNRRVEITILD